MSTPSRADGIATIAKLIESTRISMLTTMTDDGTHVSRPMTLQQIDSDGVMWFFANENSATAKEITANPSVNVSFSNTKDSEWTSIAGSAAVVHDHAKAQELWNPLLAAWFTDGLETPGLTLLRVQVDSAQYWDGPDSKVVSLLGMVRAAITRNSDNYPDTQAGTIVL